MPKTGVDLEVFPSKVAAPAVKCIERVETLRVVRHLAVDHSLTQLFMSCERTSFRCPESVAVWPVAIHMRHVWDRKKTLQEGDPAVLVQVANGEVLYLG